MGSLWRFYDWHFTDWDGKFHRHVWAPPWQARQGYVPYLKEGVR